MLGLMQNLPLNDLGADPPRRPLPRRHRDRHATESEGGIHRYTYRDAHRRARQLARALLAQGVKPADRVATLAWNTHRHFELYYGVSGIGAVLNTINPRLFPEQIGYIVNHAEDGLVFFDLTFLPLVEKPGAALQGRQVLGGADRPDAHARASSLDLLCYEELINGHSDHYGVARDSTRTRRPRCATPPAPPAIRRVCCTATARRCCTPTARLRCPTRSTSPRATWSCRWCRCSTSMPGACRTAHRWSAPSWCSPGAQLDGASLHELFEQEQVTAVRRRADRVAGPAEHLKAQGRPASARSSAW
jgi:hypothetical protein